ncbi:methylthioribose kinase-like [Asterias rubens]|uniref:methylthioribose kinase-like n=1 Tax=Asterias rubens TaxID=7604 RepID=UPI0014551617|nr:methylthioribose kinase-like [Asterias rubens]
MADKQTDTKVECNVDWERLQKELGNEFCHLECTTEELSGGESNWLFRITSKTGSSVIVKQSMGYMKCLPQLAVPKIRNKFEYSSLSVMNQLAPGSVPEPIFCDEDKSYYVMQDLFDYDILRHMFQRCQASLPAIQDVARYIAKLHRGTHKNIVSETYITKQTERPKDLIKAAHEFLNNYVFKSIHKEENIERQSPAVKELYDLVCNDPVIVANRARLRDAMATKQECVIHGDLHASSIFIKENSAKIYDLEVSHVGPAGEDIGHLLSNYMVVYLEHKFYPSKDNPTFYYILEECIKETVKVYFNDAAEYLTPEQFAATVSDTVGFMGCRLVRRILGRPEAGDDPADRTLIELPCLHLGISLTREYTNIITPSVLIQHLFDNNDVQINNK